MKPFLQHVADDLRRRLGNDLSRTVVIFPNKRASLFLNEYLLPEGETTPMWAPCYKAVNEFIQDLSPLQTADPIETICRLYRHYCTYTQSKETLDAFYCWGERLLADFDDLDKSMADATDLFKNLSDYEKIGDDFAGLDEEQREQLKRFAVGFKKETEVRSRYLHLWDALPKIYNALREELAKESLAYEGQLYRDVAEKMERGEVTLPKEYDQVAVVGLNVLNKVEHTIFQSLKAEGKALFYWDYDTYYAKAGGHSHNEAGIFIEEDLKDFPNALEDEEACFNNFLSNRDGNGQRTLDFIEAPTEAAQAESVARWLSNPKNFNPERPRETAIVLCNEALLQPVLYALPSCVREVNVTKGFPLGHTPAYASLVRHAEALSESGKGKPELSGAEFIGRLQDIMMEESAQLKPKDEHDEFMQMLHTESYYKIYTTLSRFANLIEKGLLTLKPFTLFRLLRQTMSQMSIPFHGEPAAGLQVMGVLETRCLDFRHVLMLSVGEGFLPQKATENSFIPYLLRRHFGLTTSEHKTSVYAYYFYRLLQRAERACLEYNSSTEDLRKGEMSRFMLSLLIDGSVPINRYRLNSTPRPEANAMSTAWKPKDFAHKVMQKVSPSKINAYMRCQMAFYFKYVLGIPEDLPEVPIISPTDFGTLLHKAAELFYGDLQARQGNDPITPEVLQKYVGKEGAVVLQDYVRKAIEEVNNDRTKENKKIEKGESNRTPQPLLKRTPIAESAVLRYLKLIVHFESGTDKRQELPAQAFKVVGREITRHIDLKVPLGEEGKEGSFTVRLEGNIDRLDKALLADGRWHYRIVDYKTGGQMEGVKEMDALFTAGSKHPHYAFQTFLYALMLTDDAQCKGLPIAPSLLYAGRCMNKDYSPYIKYEDDPMLDFGTIAGEFKEKFIALLQEMLDPNKPFRCAEDNGPCRTCAFTHICGRG